MRKSVVLAVALLGVCLVMMGGVSAVDVNACGTLSANTYYNLTGNITNPTADCLKIYQENITLDGNGYWIVNESFISRAINVKASNILIKNLNIDINNSDGTSGYGVYIDNATTNLDNITVRDSSFSCGTCLYARDGCTNANIYFINNTFNSNSFYPIFIAKNVSKLNISENFFNTSYPIFFYASGYVINNLVIDNNTFHNFLVGLYTSLIDNYYLTNNKFYNPSADIVYTNGDITNVTVENNYLEDFTGDDFFLRNGASSNNVSFNNNIINGSKAAYIFSFTADLTNSIFYNNSFYKTNQSGSLFIFATIGKNISMFNNNFYNCSGEIFKGNELNNSKIYNNIIYGSNSSFVSTNFTNSEIYNNIIYDGSTFGSIMLLNNSKIYNNSILPHPTEDWGECSGNGMIIRKGTNSLVYNNYIEYDDITRSGHGYMLGGDPGDLTNTTYYNNIAKHLSFAFVVHGNANNNLLYNNTAIDVDVGTYIITNPKNNRLYNMTYINSTYGVHFYLSDAYTIQESPVNNTVEGVITTNVTYPMGYTGVNLTGDNLVKNLIADNGTIKVVNSYNAFVQDVTGLENLTLSGMISNITLVNVSYTEESVTEGKLTRKWYLSSSSTINNTNITVINSTGQVVYSDLINGSIPTQTLISYINNGGTATNYSNYTITATASGYVTNITSFNLTDNANISFTLVVTPVTPVENTGSAGVSATPTYYPDEEEMNAGYAILVGANYKVNFKIGGTVHNLKVNKILNGKVNATVSSEPINFEISVGESKKFDVNGDGSYDLLVLLKEIRASRASFVLTTINEEVVDGKSNGEEAVDEQVVGDEENNLINVEDSHSNSVLAWTALIIVLVVVVLVVVAIGVLRPKRIEKWIVVKWNGN